jgi:betaine-aldehyde dehydrogenase
MKTKPQLKPHKNYVNNQWTGSKKTREVVNPFNGETIAIVAEASKKMSTMRWRQREAFDRGPWRDSTAQQRGRILFAMADLIRKNAALLAELETLNCGKPIVESDST